MNAVSECPVCGTPLSETRYAEIQEEIRSEERANYESIKLAFEADAEQRVAAAAAEAERRTREVEARKHELLLLEKEQLGQQIGDYQIREAELTMRHSRDVTQRLAEAESRLRAESDERIKLLKDREQEMGGFIEQLQAREAQLIASHETEMQQHLAAAERAVRSQLSAEFDEIRHREQETLGRIRELEARASASAEEHAIVLTQLAESHAEQLRAKAAEANSIAQAAVAEDLRVALAERNSLAERLGDLELRSAALQADYEARLQGTLSEAQRLHAEELTRQRAILDQVKGEEFAKFRAGVAEQQEALRKKLQEAERKLEQKTSHELGHWPEMNLGVALREAFPEDEIRSVGKGERGADIIHTVRYKGESCGKIAIDSKNRQQWRESFVDKLGQDQIDAEAQHAILSTAVFPQGEKDLCVRKDVILAKPNQVVSVIDLLRRTMISNHILGLSRADEGRKKDRLYQLINSDMYRQSFRTADKLCDQLQEIDAAEYAAHKKVWEHRGKLERQLERLLRDINASMAAIVEGAAPVQAPNDETAADSIREVTRIDPVARLSDAR